MAIALFRLVPMTVVMGTIFFLSHQSAEQLPLPQLPGIDKLAHFVAYAVLAATVLFGWGPERRQQRPARTVILTALWSLLYGISDELHQSLVPGRQPDLFDLLADGAGVVFTCVLWWWWRRARPEANAVRTAG
ncbi:MAG TPA: VanZ family protein [Desulforhopalus sp.]|jgi:VanZ family protein|nr:VanZ family protein [Desulforhopalus sp.]